MRKISSYIFAKLIRALALNEQRNGQAITQINAITPKVLPLKFFQRPAEIVGPELIGCRLIKRQSNGQLLWGVIVETEAYSQKDAACHGYQRRSKSNETLFGHPGKFYVYLTYGVYHCVNIVTDRFDWASGVLIRAVAIPNEHEREASGPGLVARRFGLNRSHDSWPISVENGLWLSERSSKSASNMHKIVNTTRIGISKAKDLPLRWYLQSSRSVSKRAKGDRCPTREKAWQPEKEDIQ